MTKMTKAEMFAQIKAHLVDPAEIAFIDHELELLAKKNASRPNKPTKAQAENAMLADIVLANMPAGNALTVSEIQKAVPELAELSNQRVTAIVRSLVRTGAVTRTEVKGKALFTKA